MKTTKQTYIKAVLNVITALVILALIVFLLPKAIMFFFPFVLGLIISLMAKPIVRFFEEKIKIKRKAGSAIVIVLVLAIVIAIAYGICYFLVNQIIGFASDFPNIWASVTKEFNSFGDSVAGIYEKLPKGIRDALDTLAENSEKYIKSLSLGSGNIKMGAVGDFVNKIPDVIMAIVMTLLSSYFFVADKDYMKRAMDHYLPASVGYHWDIIKRSIKNAFGGYFKAQFKIEIWIYLITAIGLLIVKVNYAVLVALGICFMDFLPVFGAGTIMVPWAIIKFVNGEYVIGIALLAIWGIGQLVRQIIQPKIVGDSVGIDPIPTLFLLFIGFAVKGVLGMILAIPIGIILKNLYEEGVFNTTIDSIQILFAGFNRYRHLDHKDREVLTAYENEVADSYKERYDSESPED